MIEMLEKDLSRVVTSVWQFFVKLIMFVGGYAAISIAQWLLMAYVAKVGNYQDVANYSYAVNVSASLFLYSDMQLRLHFVSSGAGQKDFMPYFWLRVLTSGIALLVLIVMYIGAKGIDIGLLIFGLIAAARFVHGLSDICLALPHSLSEMWMISKSGIYKGLSMAGFALLLWPLLGVVGFAAAWFLSRSFVFWVTDYKFVCRECREWQRFRFGDLVQLGKGAGELGIAQGMWATIAIMPFIFLDRISGVEQLAGYAAIGVFINAITLLITAACQILIPDLANAFRSREFNKFFSVTLSSCRLIVVVGLFVCALSFAFSLEIVTGMYGVKYQSMARMFPIAMLATFLGGVGSVLTSAMAAAGRYKNLLAIYGAGLFVGTLAGWGGALRHGAVGASVGLSLSYLTVILGAALSLRKLSKNRLVALL